jgi:uncharacterized membrane protein
LLTTKSINAGSIARNAIIAALYAAISLFLAPVSFYATQFRVSELMTLLPLINPSFGIGVTLGCFITNCFSPFGAPDIIFGTLSTALTVYFVAKIKNKTIAALAPTAFSSIVAVLISVLTNAPFLMTAASVMGSEFLITFVIGYPLYKGLLKNEKFASLLRG